VERVGGWLAGEIPDRGDGRHGDEGEDQRGQDRPADLEARVPVKLGRHAIAALAVTVAEQDPDDAALDDHEDPRRDPEDGDEQILDRLCVRALRLQRVLRGVGRAAGQQEAEGRETQDPEQPLPHVGHVSRMLVRGLSR
jgi:hypothetical protein